MSIIKTREDQQCIVIWLQVKDSATVIQHREEQEPKL